MVLDVSCHARFLPVNLSRSRDSGLPIRVGWVHLPHLPEVAAREENLGAPSMSAETSIAGLKVGIQAIVEHLEDIQAPILSRWQI